MTRALRLLALGLVLQIATVWICMSVWITQYLHQPANVCHWPLRSFIWFWPLWTGLRLGIVPESVCQWLVDTAMGWCP